MNEREVEIAIRETHNPTLFSRLCGWNWWWQASGRYGIRRGLAPTEARAREQAERAAVEVSTPRGGISYSYRYSRDDQSHRTD